MHWKRRGPRTLTETLIMQRISAFLAERQGLGVHVVHTLVADWTIIVGTRHPSIF